MYIRKLIFLFVLCLAGVYFLFEARGVLFSPSLTVTEPTQGQVFNTTLIRISGKIDANQKVSVNGKEFIPDTNGVFGGTITVDPGYRELGFSVKDRFGNETRKIVKIVVQ